MSLKGCILKHKDSDEIGILIEHMDYNENTGFLKGKVRYFPLYADNTFDWEKDTTVDDMFLCAKSDFIDSFYMLTNADKMQDFTQAEWSLITEDIE